MRKLLTVLLIFAFMGVVYSPAEAYIGNRNSKIIHADDCLYGQKTRNKVYFDNLDDALNKGYRKCKKCLVTINVQKKNHSLEAIEKIGKGMRLLKSGDNQNALRLFNEAIELDPDNALSFCNRGEAYIMLDQPEKAVEDCDKAIAMAPNLYRSYRIRARGYVLSRMSDPRPMDMSDAINDINKYLSSGYDDLNLEQAYMIRATAYYLQNQLDLALNDFKRASMENPYDPNYYITMAQIYASMKQYDGILDMANKALEVDQTCYNAYYWKSIYYFFRYCQTNDRSYLETALKEARKDPAINDDAEGRRLMEELNKAYNA